MTLVTLILLGSLLLGGCTQTGSTVPEITLDQAQEKTAAVVDGFISAIDPATVARIDDVRDESSGCRGSDVDPQGLVRQWVTTRYVTFVDGTDALTLLDRLVADVETDGWTLATSSDVNDGAGQRVNLSAPEEDRAGYGVQMSTGAYEGRPTVLTISGSSPCFDVDLDDLP
ncbi:hypothetical protein D6T64_21640 [Cryobacterium melibiosiphilum]|uniref:Uncharacterized protein n=1 Tax=Cryobacterium melibiosiphilum TaxID=995039 RepID=A0A3A5M9F5_9MICO|nr:hypothetical protein D6T64_21640 [Cryobacterium melibiosiphilum]